MTLPPISNGFFYLFFCAFWISLLKIFGKNQAVLEKTNRAFDY